MKQLLESLQQVMLGCGYVQKRGRNTNTGNTYATEQDLLAAVRPLMLEHGLFLVGPKVRGEERVRQFELDTRDGKQRGENVYVTYSWDLAHVSGEVWQDAVSVVGCGTNSKGFQDKGANKSATSAHRYALMKLLHLATGDDPEAVDPSDYQDVPGTPVSRAAEAGIAHAASPEATGDPAVVTEHLAANQAARDKPSKTARLKAAAQENDLTSAQIGDLMQRFGWPRVPKDMQEWQVDGVVSILATAKQHGVLVEEIPPLLVRLKWDAALTQEQVAELLAGHIACLAAEKEGTAASV